MKTIYVIDTSSIFDHPEMIEELGEQWNAAVYVPRAVLWELDLLKDRADEEERRRKARAAFRAIMRPRGGITSTKAGGRPSTWLTTRVIHVRTSPRTLITSL